MTAVQILLLSRSPPCPFGHVGALLELHVQRLDDLRWQGIPQAESDALHQSLADCYILLIPPGTEKLDSTANHGTITKPTEP